MRVCICGSRDGASPEVIRNLFSDAGLNPESDTIIHGGARGVDTQAGDQAESLGFVVEVFNADWTQYGRAAGPIRNKAMITTADVVYAVWNGTKGGTSNAIDTAKKLGKRVVIVRV